MRHVLIFAAALHAAMFSASMTAAAQSDATLFFSCAIERKSAKSNLAFAKLVCDQMQAALAEAYQRKTERLAGAALPKSSSPASPRWALLRIVLNGPFAATAALSFGDTGKIGAGAASASPLLNVSSSDASLNASAAANLVQGLKLYFPGKKN